MTNNFPRTRAEARLSGSIKYFTGKPCVNGHVTPRYTSVGSCDGCSADRMARPGVREALRASANAAYHADPKKFCARNVACAKKRRHEINRKRRERYAELGDEGKYLRYRDKAVKYHSLRYVFLKDQLLERSKEWKSKNQEKVRAHTRNRRAKIAGAVGAHTGQQIIDLFASQNGLCVACSSEIKSGYHVDHVMPVALGGSNYIENIQLLCPPCNLHKGAKHPDVWRALL